MTKVFTETMELANGIAMPQLGLGVYKMTNPEQTFEAISFAIETGYRAIDTAAIYENERETGEAVRHARIPREQLFITSKVWNTDQGYDATLRAFETSLEKLGLDYLDLYLTHWPITGKFVDTYKAIERLYDEKLIRATGVSNHHAHHLEKILVKANVAPMVNQIEVHPQLTQEPLRKFCNDNGIAITSWSPLARGKFLAEPTLLTIGEKYNKTTAQIIIRWHLQNNLIVIPKSVTPERIRENSEVADFILTSEDMEMINALNQDERTGTDPDTF
ncbi:aldo/keto reductase [Sporosarcina limicola]|uniref:Diketogulonate reductase-like aldo/keto reductase n=1 Tax=Sporosarcina limicola TaxID=34101 RepID=A0A927REV5_9BACL|nr:aldo/keto reductase [Sporosarcina limicola]MBE1554942.1 diketogulonate reductase-like aldo/keto reductase [Sporosarcina limicola]